MHPFSFVYPTMTHPIYFIPQPYLQEDYAYSTQYFILANTLNSYQQIPPIETLQTAHSMLSLSNQNSRLIPEGGRVTKKRESNPQRQLMSAKKNSESNIINHYFNYFTIRKIFITLNGGEEQMETVMGYFYYVIRLINMKRGRKYMNKTALLAFLSEEGLHQSISQFVDKMSRQNICSVMALSRLLLKSFYYFVRQVCFTSLLTSKRISLISKKAHLQKRRKILRYLYIKDSLH